MGKNSPNLVTLLLPSSPAAIFSSRCQKNTKSNWCRYVSAMALWPSYPLLELRILGTNATLSASNEPLVAQLKSVENIVLFCHVCFTAHSFVHYFSRHFFCSHQSSLISSIGLRSDRLRTIWQFYPFIQYKCVLFNHLWVSVDFTLKLSRLNKGY
jgi:hypothetical protein